jgi:hypothetical protein
MERVVIVAKVYRLVKWNVWSSRPKYTEWCIESCCRCCQITPIGELERVVIVAKVYRLVHSKVWSSWPTYTDWCTESCGRRGQSTLIGTLKVVAVAKVRRLVH